MSTASPMDPYVRLSAAERAQLGAPRILRSGLASDYGYVPEDLWPAVRSHMLARSRAAAARYLPHSPLEERFTAYTPGETLALLREPEMQLWHAQMSTFSIPEHDEEGREYQGVAFVPCAKTKPWDSASVGLYGGYNAVRRMREKGEVPPLYFVTISEPLGVVPEAHWGDFPQYDNPGLFRDEVQRSGLLTADWKAVEGVGRKYIVPFDEEAYDEAIDRLAGVIRRFVEHNRRERPALRFLSFVENLDRQKSTHTDMLERANGDTPFLSAADTHRKKGEPRTSPAAHIAAILRESFPAPSVRGIRARGGR